MLEQATDTGVLVCAVNIEPSDLCVLDAAGSDNADAVLDVLYAGTAASLSYAVRTPDGGCCVVASPAAAKPQHPWVALSLTEPLPGGVTLQALCHAARAAATEVLVHVLPSAPKAAPRLVCRRESLSKVVKALVHAGCLVSPASAICPPAPDASQLSPLPDDLVGVWRRSGTGAVRLQASTGVFVDVHLPANSSTPESCCGVLALDVDGSGTTRHRIVDFVPPRGAPLRTESKVEGDILRVTGDVAGGEEWCRLGLGSDSTNGQTPPVMALELVSEEPAGPKPRTGMWIFCGDIFARCVGPRVGEGIVAGGCVKSLAHLVNMTGNEAVDKELGSSYDAVLGTVEKPGVLRLTRRSWVSDAPGTVLYDVKEGIGGKITVFDNGFIEHKYSGGPRQKWAIREMGFNPFGKDPVKAPKEGKDKSKKKKTSRSNSSSSGRSASRNKKKAKRRKDDSDSSSSTSSSKSRDKKKGKDKDKRRRSKDRRKRSRSRSRSGKKGKRERKSRSRKLSRSRSEKKRGGKKSRSRSRSDGKKVKKKEDKCSRSRSRGDKKKDKDKKGRSRSRPDTKEEKKKERSRSRSERDRRRRRPSSSRSRSQEEKKRAKTDNAISRSRSRKASPSRIAAPKAPAKKTFFDSKEPPPSATSSDLFRPGMAGGQLQPGGMPPLARPDNECEQFLASNPVDPEAAARLRALPPHLQRIVLDRGPLFGTKNPSAVLIVRIRDAEKGGPNINQALGAPAPPPQHHSHPGIEGMISKYSLDARAAQMLRCLPPQQQAMAAEFPLHEARNPSAFVMAQLQAGRVAPASSGMLALPATGIGTGPMPGQLALAAQLAPPLASIGGSGFHLV